MSNLLRETTTLGKSGRTLRKRLLGNKQKFRIRNENAGAAEGLINTFIIYDKSFHFHFPFQVSSTNISTDGVVYETGHKILHPCLWWTLCKHTEAPQMCVMPNKRYMKISSVCP